MPYDPRRPHAERYVHDAPRGAAGKKLLKRIEQDALTLCRALGYDLNTVEFAVEDGVPYAIDFMNPAPDADLHSVGAANFEWIVEQVAEMAIAKARTAPQVPELRWSAFLGAAPAGPAKKSAKAAPKKKKLATRPKKNELEAEVERAAAEQEPMGSIAAAVPGDDAAAENAIEAAELPGAEAPEIRDEPETTAGTEAKIEGEEIATSDQA